MKTLLHRLASARLMIAGFGLLAAATLWSYNVAEPPPGVITAPLALLALNLASAIVLRPALRRGGLGVFHLCLLALLLLAGAGRLLHFDGRVELPVGSELDGSRIEVASIGPLHGEGWRQVGFLQGPFQVDYLPGPRRTHTRSEVWLPGETAARVVGDQLPVVVDGYRFYTTHNKGFAPLLTWKPQGGAPLQGVLHMPSYPGHDWKQENRWTAPDGRTVKFWLRIERPIPQDAAWTLDPHDTPSVLIAEIDGQRQELKPGDTLQLPGASLTYERLTGWMGYKIFYDPTVIPMLVVAVLGVLGLGWHLWGRSLRLLHRADEVAA